ncbi:FMN-binding protein [Sinomonas terrae]|uniref:FMN-binding protein n=1 Tax=Sinomonas terrae TaxID=2908838 RepID=A0ABS9TX68_9MICC|nr:FMN-binding protein [Sinomonas terrae]MCH6468807.1 FMN-binding protein [Sinomonas terrae]
MRARAAAAAALASFGILAIGWQAGAQSIEASKVTGVTNSATNGNAGTASSGSSTSTGSSGTNGAAAGTTGSGTTGSGTTGSSGTSGSSTSNSGSASSGGQASTSSALKNGTFTGTAEETRYGIVQVQVVVSGGKITDVQTPQLTGDDMRSDMINSEAAPILRSEVLQAQSANVDTVSGATYTSEGYVASLQAALNAAHA